MDNLKKTRKIIEKHQNIVILPSSDMKKDSYPAALGLCHALKKLGKNVSMLGNTYSETFSFLPKDCQTDSQQKADIRISIRETGAKLSDLFYEKIPNGINLFLKTSGGELKKEDVVFEKLNDKSDQTTTKDEILITIGINSFTEIQGLIKEDPTYIINIDNDQKNENFGHANVIEPNSATLSEVVLQIISFISEDLFDKNISTPLLAGIIHQAPNIGHSLNPQSFQKVGFLVEQGADLQTISKELNHKIQENPVHLFGEVLTKTHFSESHNLGWVTLKENDFVKTNSTPKDLRFTLKRISSNLFPFRNFLILWEQHDSPVTIKGIFYSPSKTLTEKVANHFKGVVKGKGVLFNTGEDSLQSAKDKLITILSP
ncbi:MAG: hypothetical protein HQ539_01475 [Parcubacteria group bacterium]|nr:hypothetical protein [Parcubacteria group bacterium]